MATIAIVSAAYYGDVMPFVPVANELARRGHEVTMAVPRGFHDVLRDDPVTLVHLGTDFSPGELADHGDVLDRADSPRGVRAAAELWVNQMTVEPAAAILDVLSGLTPDLWLVHPSVYWLVEIAAAPTGTPTVVGHLFPMMIPSRHQAPPMLPGGRVPGVNRLGWRLTRTLAGRMMYDDRINHLRAASGLRPETGNVGFGYERADRTLVLTSPTYWPRPPDWDDDVVMTGFTVWNGGAAPVPDDLARFLDDGPPPVLVTLGTSAATNARDAFALVARVVEDLGHRPLLLVGNDRNRRALADRRDAWTFAPLPAVLAHCRAVVHAGGHGTTAAALHAGIPQVAMPQGFDQLAHASRIVDLGVGAALPFRRRSPARVREALEHALASPAVGRAHTLAERLRPEAGPATAADEIEHVLAGRTPRS